jgi:outer membrane protein TolC
MPALIPRSIVLLLIATRLATPLAAQQPPLTVHEAVSRALASHPTLEAASRALDGARAGVAESAGARWPNLRLEAAATRFQEPMVVAPLHGFDPQLPPAFDQSLFQVTLGANYLLFDGGRRSAMVSRGEAGVRLHEAELHAVTQRLVADVVQAWLAVSAGRALLGAEEQQLEALHAERNRVRQFLEVGRAAAVEGLRVDASVAQAEAARVSRQEEATRSEGTLARLIGTAVESIRSSLLSALRPAAPLAPLAELQAEARAGSPDLARARARLGTAAALARGAGSGWWPELRLVGGYTDYASGQGRLTGEWQAGVRVGYNLFTGGSRAAASRRASSEQLGAAAEVAALELRLDDAVERSVALARAAGARASALTVAVAQHAEVARIEELALAEGAGTQRDWLAAQAALLLARSALIEARHAEVSARVELARLTGTLTPAVLQTLVEAVP